SDLLPTSWGFVQGTVDGDLAHIESDDLVVVRERLSGDGVEDPGFNPLVAPGPQVVSETTAPMSRSASSHEHPVTRRMRIPQSRPGRHLGPMAAERVRIVD